MSQPATATSEVFPDWTNLVDKWREQDAEWLRNRSVLLFATAAARDAAITAPAEGMCCYLKDSNELLFYNGTAWVGHDLMVVSRANPTAPTAIRDRKGSGGGLALTPTGIAAVDIDGGTVKATTALVVVTGTKTARLTTDATTLVSDTPIKVGSSTVNGNDVSTPKVNTTDVAATNVVATAVSGATVTGASVLGTTAVRFGGASPAGELVSDGNMVKMRRVGGTSYIGVRNDGWSFINENFHVSPTGATRLRQPNGYVMGGSDANGPTAPHIMKDTGASAPVASIWVATSAPGAADAPEGCLWIQA